MRLIVGIAGASGTLYGIRILQLLRAMDDVETHLVMTSTARMNVHLETDMTVADIEALADVVHKNSNVGASIASGSFRTDGMVVAACSMKTLSAIVHSYADNLLVRAADVMLKERRPLVLMPRETPLHKGHCALLLGAADLGAIIAPPSPALYLRPQSIDDMINHSAARTLELLGLDVPDMQRWTGA